jgi:hypothetical protein
MMMMMVDSTVQFRVSRDLGLGFQDDDDAREQRARDRSRERVAASERASFDHKTDSRYTQFFVASIACCSFCVVCFFCVANGKVHQVQEVEEAAYFEARVGSSTL